MTFDDFKKAVNDLKLNVNFGLRYIEVDYLKKIVAMISIYFQQAYIHQDNIKKLDKETQRRLQELVIEFAETPPRERKMFR